MKNLLIPSKIIFAKRRTISLIINSKGEFIVRAPYFCSKTVINEFILKKSNWIVEKRQEKLNTQNSIYKRKSITVLDKNYKVILSNSTFYDKDNFYLDKINLKTSLIQILESFALSYIPKRVKELANYIGFTYKKVGITKATTRWGSCSATNNLNFSLFLVLCDKDVVDYVIIHELCHTKIKNHSKDFWNLVESYCNNYKICEKKLKEYSKCLNFN